MAQASGQEHANKRYDTLRLLELLSRYVALWETPPMFCIILFSYIQYTKSTSCYSTLISERNLAIKEV